METTITLIILTAITAFAFGWHLRNNQLESSMKMLLKSMQSNVQQHKEQLSMSNMLFDMQKHRSMLYQSIDKLMLREKEMRQQIQELSPELIEAMKLKHEQEQEQKKLKSNRIEQLKSKSGALKQS